MIFLAALLSLSTPQIDCTIVREKVAEYGKARALAWALENGFTWRQIAEARQCLKSK